MSLGNITKETLLAKKERLQKEIDRTEKLIITNKSFLYGLYLNNSVKRNKEKIRNIDVELCYREHNSL